MTNRLADIADASHDRLGLDLRVKNSQSESLRQGNRNMERVIEVFC